MNWRSLFTAPVIAATILMFGGLVVRNIPVFAIGLVGLVAALFLAGNTQTRKNWEATGEQELSHDSRALLRPVRRLHEDLREFVSAHGDSGPIKVLGAEAVREADNILEQSLKLLRVRDRLKYAARGKSEAEVELRRMGDGDPNDPARVARQLEMQHYGEIESSIPKIETSIGQAVAALSELKARLAVSAASVGQTAADGELEETMSRLRALSASFDEAEELLESPVR